MVHFEENLINTRILPILISSFTFIVLSSFAGNSFQPPCADFNFNAVGDYKASNNDGLIQIKDVAMALN